MDNVKRYSYVYVNGEAELVEMPGGSLVASEDYDAAIATLGLLRKEMELLRNKADVPDPPIRATDPAHTGPGHSQSDRPAEEK